MSTLVVALPGNEVLAESLCKGLGATRGEAEFRHFPDGESYVRIVSEVKGSDVVLACTLSRPDDKLLPLFFAARACKDHGARRVGLVTPYLAYMRQDREFRVGEAVTSGHFARLISEPLDWLVTVDPHLHRIHNLNDLYPIESVTLHAAPLIAEWMRAEIAKPVLVGPDSESEQWVRAVAEQADSPFVVLEKVRHGDRDVEVSVPEVERWNGHTPVLVDDIVSTARTMIETVGHLKHAGMAPPVCIGVHAVFAGTAYSDLLAAGVARVVTCDTIPHESNAISVGTMLSDAARACIARS